MEPRYPLSPQFVVLYASTFDLSFLHRGRCRLAVPGSGGAWENTTRLQVALLLPSRGRLDFYQALEVPTAKMIWGYRSQVSPPGSWS